MAEDSPALRSLVIGLVSLVCVALIIGGVFSILALGAANVAGLASSGATQQPSLYMPPLKGHTPPPPEGAAPAVVPTPAPSPTLSAKPTPTKHHRAHHRHRITLVASPQQVSPSEKIDLSGTYPGGNGSSLQVQNRQNGQWTAFPVSVTVHDGRFRTYIYSANPGKQRFRVVDQTSGRHSNVVTITIG